MGNELNSSVLITLQAAALWLQPALVEERHGKPVTATGRDGSTSCNSLKANATTASTRFSASCRERSRVGDVTAACGVNDCHSDGTAAACLGVVVKTFPNGHWLHPTRI